MDAKLIYEGNPRLMVGNIRPGEQAGTFLVDILTVDNSLVETRTISAATGRQIRGN
ncbi:MAG: hypothetical protein HZT40_03280 [Candidatus Thiothrix singaporensis]|uniref:Uncharacterized protein n=1 Tax=Candidatus Thiothrix singaporensis TaxID=2799669 RepID=A0A7L6ANW1_9GAMM|nr:MAG: hypothetical protein HZT40_03280 [Candidatus Thiothrix singaporensis]